MVPKYSGYAQTVAAMFVGLTITGTTATNAQTTIGKRNSAAVSVDLSVLDQLGGTTNVPQLLRPSVRSLLMPNARQPTRSRFSPLVQPQLQPPSASTSSLKVKPPTGMKRRAVRAERKVAKKPPSKPRMTAPAATKVAPPPPPPPLALNLPKPAVNVPPPPPTQQTASLTSRPAPTDALNLGQQFRLGFSSGSAAISDGAATQLDGVAKSMKQNGNLRLQLLAYAGGGSQTPSQARRLSLSRALAVRSQLIEKGIQSTRIDVRALGNKLEAGPPDRVDIIITTR